MGEVAEEEETWRGWSSFLQGFGRKKLFESRVGIGGLDALWTEALGIEVCKSLASMAVTTTPEANHRHDAGMVLASPVICEGS
ncbi:hypothetical protein DVH24_036101 [Malus domestica]|uniref:Uncharacterized protein n=1 Tax=Malus domestica TaxID=3750 RepID=A0A498IEU9_MALDO|nr:hypothetical protein DVH24_036101 [Malus domestica]